MNSRSGVLLEKLTFCQIVVETFPYLGNSKIQYSMHNSTTFVPILSQQKPVYDLQSYFKLLFNNIFPLDLRFPSGLFSSSFPSKTLHALAAPDVFYIYSPSLYT